MPDIERLWIVFAWFSMTWFASTVVSLLVLQFLLPAAWNQIRANPPHGPAWAHTLWYDRERVYGTIVTLCLLLGVIAGLLYFFIG